MKNSFILAVSGVVPPYVYTQEEIIEKSLAILPIEQEKVELFRRIYQNSAIEKRYSVINDFQKSPEERNLFGPSYPLEVPGMTKRNEIYKKEAPRLAEKAARKVLEEWGGDPSSITHLISISCTGVIAPGIEYYLMQNLGLAPTINRLGINFMGCFGAFKGLSVARAFAEENPSHRILLVCTELCSLHLQADLDPETLTANSLFSDGSAAAIIGASPLPYEKPLWEIVRTHSLGFENSMGKMSWEASDKGFLIRLSPTVPVLIKRKIKDFIDGLLKSKIDIQTCDFAIHPGGKSILQAIERSLQLSEDQTKASWQILANYGNMSSATFLFVLEKLSKQGSLRPWTVGIGFGPGLSTEGVLLSYAH